jgi:hypothetical protein
MISITLPSLTPSLLERALTNLRSVTEGEYEVIVVSPFAPCPPLRNVEWIKDDEEDGPYVAHGKAFRAARGEFVLGWVDDHRLAKDWDVEAMLMLEELERRRLLVCLGLRHADADYVGTVFGYYYPYFPFMRRKSAKKVGWLDVGRYRCGFADADLGMRVWDAKGWCAWSSPLVSHVDEDRQREVLDDGQGRYTLEDKLRFLGRWYFRYGKGYATTDISSFNIDVQVDRRPELMRNQTIWGMSAVAMQAPGATG